MRVVGIVAPFAALGVGTCGKFVLSNPRPQGGNGPRRRVPGAPNSGTRRESQAKFRERAVWGL